MTDNINNENKGLGDFLAAELQGVIRERELRAQLLANDLEREIRQRIGKLYELGDELKECYTQLKIEMPVAVESEDPNAPNLKEQKERRNGSYDSYGNYRFGGGGQGGLPPGLWGW